MRFKLLLFASLLASAPAIAQQPSSSPVSAEDYARAESFLSANTAPLAWNVMSDAAWLSEGRFLYRNRISEGHEFILVDVMKRTRSRAFDHEKMAQALSAELDVPCDPFKLPFARFEFSSDGRAIDLEIKGRRYRCDLQSYECNVLPDAGPDDRRNTVISPDGKLAAFIRDHNLWLRDLGNGRETQLTTDGAEDFGYAVDNAGWTKSGHPILLWAPNSDKIATFQQDARGVGEMHLVATNVGHPRLESWKYPLPGDKDIFRIQRVVIHLDGPRVVRLKMPPDPQRSTISDHIADGDGNWLDVEWNNDGSKLAFVSTSRDHKQARLRTADAETGEVRDVMEENVATFFESGNRKVNWHVLPDSNEVIWFSERDDWGHLYLYDLRTGQLKNRITQGNWNVLQLLRIDKKEHMLFFTGAGREPGDPYFRYLYSIRMDGKGLKLLTPENADHSPSLSPSGLHFVDTYSTPVTPPVSVLRDVRGRRLLTLEEADISPLTAKGWKPPVPVKVKARDGKTDLYGLMYKPTKFDPSRSYPVLNYIYPGPQSGSVGSRSFSASRSDKQSLAELGFIVVEIDALGTPGRSKSFHEFYYGNMGDNGLPDQIAAIRELAGRNPWMDIGRVGVWGMSGGGFASTDAILRYPDFYKVAVSMCGNHDNRNYEDDWGEKWQGLLETGPDGTSNYDNQANQLLVKNLKGKLLLAHGTMDNNVPFYNTLLVVNALIAANKDFDLILFPNRSHGFFQEPYMMRLRWDYFVRHLLGVDPPKEYKFKADAQR